MKRVILFLFCCTLLATAGIIHAATVEAPADCKYCGMDRTKFAHSRMLITYADGSRIGTCSINCAGVDRHANSGKQVTSYQVGDYTTKKLIDAKTAVWVIGGKKRGVMTPVAKWAFGDKQAASAFVTENGGKIATFDEAFADTEKELTDDHNHGSHDRKGHDKHNH
jgi:nitrous oxide reductase accessory protein NosL